MTDSPAHNPHLDMEVVRHGPPIASARLVVVAVHGRGQAPQYMLDNLAARLDIDDIHWVLPCAHGGSWYPLGFMAPLHDNQPLLDHALATLDQVAASIHDVPSERVVWAGFSQGACLASEWVARHPRRWAGLLAFTGGRIGPGGTDLSVPQANGRFDGMPAYFGAGAHDQWVPLDRVERTAAAYRSAGANVSVDVFDDDLHEIRPAEITRALSVLRPVGR